MFSKAYKRALPYSLPFIYSHRIFGGGCDSQYGTLILINNEGWFITVKHIFSDINKYLFRLESFRSKLQRGQPIDANDITHVSCHVGYKSLIYISAKTILHSSLDLAIGKIESFDKSLCSNYPFFRPKKNKLEFGMSLCTMGYCCQKHETHLELVNTHNDPLKMNLSTVGPSGMHLYPTPGIFSMEVNDEIYISSPGIVGQSGGPIVDTLGNVCGIQIATGKQHLDLDPENPETEDNRIIKNQYYHLGIGIHYEAITDLLNLNKIKFNQ